MGKFAILCVDDEEMILQSLKNELDAFSDDYLIELAEDGDEALEVIADLAEDDYEIALVISDYVMPRIKGDELLHKIHVDWPSCLKIMLTGQSSVKGITNAINKANLYRYIAKPWEKEDLVLTIQEALVKFHQTKKLETQNKLLEVQNEELRGLNTALEEKVAERTSEIVAQKDEILQQKEELSGTYEALKKLAEFKEIITGTIVHDLKNPLNSIISLSEDASIKQAGRQMLNLVLSILDVQKFEDATFQVVTSETDIQEIVQTSFKEIELLAKNKNQELLCNIPNSIKVNVDTDIVVRIFVNLLTNAIKYTPNNGEITLGYSLEHSTSEKQVCLYVSDTGEGIPEDKQASVFDRFVQVHARQLGMIRSTGIGLTFCKLAVNAHGGEIWVASKPQEGTTFFFTLPCSSPLENLDTNTQVLMTNQKTTLSAEERQLLIPLVDDFARLEIYDTSSVQLVLSKVDFTQSSGLSTWYDQMLDALFSVNETKYEELLEELR